MIKTIDFALTTKSLGDAGEFEGYASTFGNVDLGGDVVEPGAFIDGLVGARKSSRFIPMLWQHQQDQPIGKWLDMAEDTKGLWVKGQIILDADPVAQRAYAKLKAGALGGLSIGYVVPTGGATPDDKRRGVTRLTKVDLREISLVTMPMNPEAKVTGVKAEFIELRDRLAAGDRLTEREMEALFKSDVPLGLTNAQAERAVRLNVKAGRGAPGADDDEARAFFEALGRA